MTLVDLARRLLGLELAKATDPDRQKRIHSALNLIDSVQPEKTYYRVVSRSLKEEETYQVTQWWCTCADHKYRSSQGIICAHRTAVQAYQKAKENLAHVEACEKLGLVA